MRRPGRLTQLLILTSVVSAGAARAGIVPQADTAFQLFCSDADGSKHPKRLEFRQILTAEQAEAARNGRLLIGYDRDGDDTGSGRITATARLQPAQGSRRKIGKISVTLNRVTGETVGGRELGVELAAGDTLSWTWVFKKFMPLNAGQCVNLIAGTARESEGCGPYAPAASSPYTLPIRAGQASVMSQANCSTIGSHRFAARHAYDFALPIGTELLAIADGIVQFANDQGRNGTGLSSDENVLQILHDDGTYANYVHLTQGGALVSAGQRVAQGEAIARSGNSGSTSGVPHLHLQLMSCPQRSVCGTLPMTFSNTSAHANGLQVGQLYRAR